MRCKICSGVASQFDEGLLLGKHSVAYFVCSDCGFVFTETPYWLDEAYSEVISSKDIGLIGRNREMTYYTKSIIQSFFNPNGTFLDYGGGYGVFVRMMRDEGFDFYRYDPMCQNLFAVGLDLTDAPIQVFEAVTAFEVLEHLVDPLAEIEKMLAFSKTLIFSTMLVSTPPMPVKSWWYYGVEHGQHVALYTVKALQRMARRFSLNFYTNYSNLHILTQESLPAWRVKAIFHPNPLFRMWVNLRRQRPSLLLQDVERLKQSHLSKPS